MYSWKSSSKRSSQEVVDPPPSQYKKPNNENKRQRSQSPKSSTSKSSSGEMERESWGAVTTDAKEILAAYYESCKEQHELMLERIKNVKTAFYAEVGKLTIEKDKKLKELYTKHKISFEGALLLELPLYVNNAMEEEEEADKQEELNSQENEKSDSPTHMEEEVEESSVAEIYNDDIGTQDSLSRPFNLATPPKKDVEDEYSV